MELKCSSWFVKLPLHWRPFTQGGQGATSPLHISALGWLTFQLQHAGDTRISRLYSALRCPPALLLLTAQSFLIACPGSVYSVKPLILRCPRALSWALSLILCLGDVIPLHGFTVYTLTMLTFPSPAQTLPWGLALGILLPTHPSAYTAARHSHLAGPKHYCWVQLTACLYPAHKILTKRHAHLSV